MFVKSDVELDKWVGASQSDFAGDHADVVSRDTRCR